MFTAPKYEHFTIPHGDVDYFLHLFFSHSTESVKFFDINTVDNWVGLGLRGPTRDDERMGASFKLSRDALISCLPGEMDRYAFVARLYELAWDDRLFTAMFPVTCKILRLRKLDPYKRARIRHALGPQDRL